MIVVQLLLAFIIFVGIGIGLYRLGIDAGIRFTGQFPEDDRPVIYRRRGQK